MAGNAISHSETIRSDPRMPKLSTPASDARAIGRMAFFFNQAAAGGQSCKSTLGNALKRGARLLDSVSIQHRRGKMKTLEQDVEANSTHKLSA